MASQSGDESDRRSLEYPRFEHGVDLLIVDGPGPTVKFQTTTLGQWLRSDTMVCVEDEC